MKIALIGATGFVGAALLNEALSRGHTVTAIVRDTSKLPQKSNLKALALDVFDTPALTAALAGHDALIASYNPGWSTPNEEMRGTMAKGGAAIIASAKAAKVRLLAVGGAGSLEVAPGLQAIDTPDFPAQWKAGAEGTRDYLKQLRTETGLEWTFLSPAFELFPGERTGKYRTGGDQAFFDAEGKSRISTADYAVAMLDELEAPKHTGRRFSVAY
jgi:putative NADH-flavin reductase